MKEVKTRQFDTLAAILDKATKEELGQQKDIYLNRPEMQQVFAVHTSLIAKAFVSGTVEAHPWSMEVKLPTKIDSVANWLVFMWQKEEENFVVQYSIKYIVEKSKGWAFEHPEFLKWELDRDSLFCNMALDLFTYLNILERTKKDLYGKDKSILP